MFTCVSQGHRGHSLGSSLGWALETVWHLAVTEFLPVEHGYVRGMYSVTGRDVIKYYGQKNVIMKISSPSIDFNDVFLRAIIKRRYYTGMNDWFYKRCSPTKV